MSFVPFIYRKGQRIVRNDRNCSTRDSLSGLTPDEEKDMINKMVSGDLEAYDQFITLYIVPIEDTPIKKQENQN